MRALAARAERWPLSRPFVLSRGGRTEQHVVVAEIEQGQCGGRGECTPYARYGETPDSVLAQIEAVRGDIEAGVDRAGLQDVIAPGAARNALDCALWDLDAKLAGRRAWDIAGRTRLDPVKTAYTVSFGPAQEMAAAARAAAGRPLLKLKIGGPGDLDRVEAVRAAAPKTRLVVDANEGMSFDDLKALAPELNRLGVLLIEQPLKAGADEELEGYASPVPLCADESLHTRLDLEACARRYACVNIKLDKAGGLTEALALAAEARSAGLMIMAGCMLGTSLAMAPAMLIAQGADFVDLDGPLWLKEDRDPGLVYLGSMIEPPSRTLWG